MAPASFVRVDIAASNGTRVHSICRPSPHFCRLYAIWDGQRRMIASLPVTELQLGDWHRIRVVAQG